MAKVYREYDRRLRESNGLDFDDLISQTVRLLEQDEEVRTRYQNKFRYILVDEYQDVNYAQYRLCAILAEEHKNLTVVGDDDQSIYSWRGSDYKNILRFEEDFPGAKIFKLEENYRSTEAILAVANELVVNNQSRSAKVLFTKRAVGEPVTAYGAETERMEARYVVEKIKEHVRDGAAYRDFLTLYRTNAQSRVFEETLLSEGIPYRVVGGVGFYARTEVKDMMAYLRYIVNPSDAVAFRRIVNVPRRSIGQQTLASLVDAANSAGVSVGQTIFDKEMLRRAVPKKQKELERFAELITDLRSRVDQLSISELLVAVMEESGYIRELQAEDTSDARSRLENLQELIGVAREFEGRDNDSSLDQFLSDIALISDLDTLDPDSSFVTLMTMHAAKGLESPIVFLTGLEEGVFPNQRAQNDMAELEEERRLAYVGITRAMDRLYLSYAMRRTLYRQHLCAPAFALLGRDAERRSAGRRRALTASGGRTLARSLDPRNRRRRDPSGLAARRPGAPSQVGRGPRRRGHRGRRGRFADDQLPERRAEDGHAQVRSAREGLGRRRVGRAPARSGGLGRGSPATRSIRRSTSSWPAPSRARGSANRSPTAWA